MGAGHSLFGKYIEGHIKEMIKDIKRIASQVERPEDPAAVPGPAGAPALTRAPSAVTWTEEQRAQMEQSNKEMEGMNALFEELYKKYDINGDGELEEDEIKALCKEAMETLKMQLPKLIDVIFKASVAGIDDFLRTIAERPVTHRRSSVSPAEVKVQIQDGGGGGGKEDKAPDYKKMKSEMEKAMTSLKPRVVEMIKNRVDEDIKDVDRKASLLFRQLDADFSGKVTKDEFMASFGEKMLTTVIDLKDLFRIISREFRRVMFGVDGVPDDLKDAELTEDERAMLTNPHNIDTDIPPTLVGNLHWTRVLFFTLFAVSLGLTIAYFMGSDVPTFSVVLLFLVGAAVGFALIWNYATTKDLAESAEKLKQLMIASKAALEDQERNLRKTEAEKERLRRNNLELEEKVQKMQQGLQLLGGEVKDLNVVESKLRELNSQNAEMMRRREELSNQQRRFLLDQALDRLERERQDVRRRIRDQFMEADKDGSGYLNGDEEIALIQEYLRQFEIPWNPAFDADDDGKVTMVEFMTGVDAALEKRFVELREAIIANAQLQEELDRKQLELAKARAKLDV